MIVDVDSHWEAIDYSSGEHPLEPWRDELPAGSELLAFGVAGDLLAGLAPPRPTVGYGAPPGSRGARQGPGWAGDPAPAARVVGR
jgi:hypothetical protein